MTFWDEYGHIIVALVMLIGGGLLIWAIIEVSMNEQRKWDTFAAAHECKVTGRTAAHTQFGWGWSNGKWTQINQFVPAQTGYTCDDGVTYWR